jgi:hypothetical protein
MPGERGGDFTFKNFQKYIFLDRVLVYNNKSLPSLFPDHLWFSNILPRSAYCRYLGANKQYPCPVVTHEWEYCVENYLIIQFRIHVFLEYLECVTLTKEKLVEFFLKT